MKQAMLTLVVLLLGATTAPAEGWAEKMFKDKDNKDNLSFDFGNVPRGSQLYHRFAITNIYAVRMEITGITSGCGCTEAVASKRVLEPRESATIDVSMDARRFSGPKTVDIRITVGPEFTSTATLKVTANSRADLVFNPGEISFGTVTRGEKAEQSIEIDYAGSFNWQATEVVAKDLPLDVKLMKINRPTGQVGYKVIATLKADAPSGTLKEEIYLKTNDPNSPLVPIVVVATIQAAVVVTPTALNLGGVKIDETLTRRVVVRGAKAFKILGVDGLGNGLILDNQLSAEETAVQTLTFKVKAEKAGEFKRELKIRTSLQETPIVVTIEGNAVP